MERIANKKVDYEEELDKSSKRAAAKAKEASIQAELAKLEAMKAKKL